MMSGTRAKYASAGNSIAKRVSKGLKALRGVQGQRPLPGCQGSALTAQINTYQRSVVP